MSKSDQLNRLQNIAHVMLDSQLAGLKLAARAVQDTQNRLAGLAASPVPTGELSDIAVALSGLAYERWADARRVELNLILARQTAIWLDASDAARQSFGKTQALDAVKRKLLEGTRRGKT